ncbi:hypothetical protein V6N13_105642 [Hibiscus sabdariffa]
MRIGERRGRGNSIEEAFSWDFGYGFSCSHRHPPTEKVLLDLVQRQEATSSTCTSFQISSSLKLNFLEPL